jgi:hypothetical protein
MATLSAVAVIAFGAALVPSSSSVRHLFVLQSTVRRLGTRSATEMLAGEMAPALAGSLGGPAEFSLLRKEYQSKVSSEKAFA